MPNRDFFFTSRGAYIRKLALYSDVFLLVFFYIISKVNL